MAAHPIPKIEYGNLFTNVISFDYPPSEGRKREEIEVNGKTSESLSGLRQVQVNFMEATRKLKFRFVSETLMTEIETFFQSWAALGKSFRFYQDKNSLSYVLYEIDQKKLQPKEILATDGDTYIYEVELAFRRVLDEVGSDAFMEFTILNNQGVALSLAGLVYDSTLYKSVRIFYELVRKTDSSERVANGEMVVIYNALTNDWTLKPGMWEGDPAPGVTFSITALGQVQYTSDNQAGANYSGVLKIRNFTIEDV